MKDMICAPFGGTMVLAEVTDIQDPEDLSRVAVTFPLHGDDDQSNSVVWAPVATSFAGEGYGAFCIPNVGEVVVLGFLNNDPRTPIVLGAIWHGGAKTEEEVSGGEIDRWSLTGRAGTRIAIVEASDGSPTIEIHTKNGPSITVTDEEGGRVTVTAGGSEIEMTSSEISITASSVSIDAAEFSLSAGSCSITTPLADFSAVIKSQVCQATTVTAGTYTTGAGNIL